MLKMIIVFFLGVMWGVLTMAICTAGGHEDDYDRY